MEMKGRIMNKAQLAVAISLLAFSGLSQAQTDKRQIESIEVFGQKTTPQLERAFDKQRFEFLALYNSINNVAQFDVICKYQKTIGSKIARKNCEPRYLKDFRAMAMQTSSTTGYIEFNRLPSDDQIRFLTKVKREEAFEHVAALIATHPELYDSFTKLDAINQRIEQRKEEN